MLPLDLIQTPALAGLVLFAGYFIRSRVPWLDRYNVPAAVVGGLLASALLAASRSAGLTLLQLDNTLQQPLMVAFFTSVGFGASLSLLRRGGPAVAWFTLLATVVAIAQNLLGASVAWALGEHPLLGVLAGSVTLTGGPATGLAFAPLFEQAGLKGAPGIAVAAAMAGIVCGGILGGPIGTWLVEKRGMRPGPPAGPRPAGSGPLPGSTDGADPALAFPLDDPMSEPALPARGGEDIEGHGPLLRGLVAMLVAMGLGSWISAGLTSLGLTLPAYIGAMLAASALRNLDDATGWLGLSQRLLDELGGAALSLFLVLALLGLKLHELLHVALPLAVVLVFQVALIAVLCAWVVPRLMGRDYDAAVMSSGFCGFMLGTTANAMANMGALVERYGPAPRAYLVVPMVGAFFIDFTNALLITVSLNLFR